MKLWLKIVFLIGSLILAALLFSLLVIFNVMKWASFWAIIAIIGIFLGAIMCIIIYNTFFKEKQDPNKMLLNGHQNIEYTKNEMLMYGIEVEMPLEQNKKLINETFPEKGVIIHIFSAYATIGYKKELCLFGRCLNNLDLFKHYIGWEGDRTLIRQWVNELSSQKIAEDIETREVTDLDKGQYVKYTKKSSKPAESEQESKQGIVPEKAPEKPIEVPKPEGAKS